MKKSKGGIDPKKLPAIKYCKKHSHFLNLYPHCSSSNGMHSSNVMYRVVCGDCDAFGTWENTPAQAIISWNKHCGISS